MKLSKKQLIWMLVILFTVAVIAGIVAGPHLYNR